MNGRQLPFFVYGTLRPGERNHDLLLRGRTTAERPALLPGAVLYEGPGHPYAVDADNPAAAVTGEAVTAKQEEYGQLLAVLDRLEEYGGPGHPTNLYERVSREVLLADGTPVRTWVYVAAERVARVLRAGGTTVDGGDWHEAVSRR